MKFKLLDVVETISAIPDAGILAGTTGTIVDVYPDGEYEIEFVNDNGETRALVPLAADQLQYADRKRKAA